MDVRDKAVTWSGADRSRDHIPGARKGLPKAWPVGTREHPTRQTLSINLAASRDRRRAGDEVARQEVRGMLPGFIGVAPEAQEAFEHELAPGIDDLRLE